MGKGENVLEKLCKDKEGSSRPKCLQSVPIHHLGWRCSEKDGVLVTTKEEVWLLLPEQAALMASSLARTANLGA